MNRGLARFIGDMFDFFADHASFLTIVGAVCFLFGPSLLVVLERKERLPRVVVAVGLRVAHEDHHQEHGRGQYEREQPNDHTGQTLFAFKNDQKARAEQKTDGANDGEERRMIGKEIEHVADESRQSPVHAGLREMRFDEGFLTRHRKVATRFDLLLGTTSNRPRPQTIPHRLRRWNSCRRTPLPLLPVRVPVERWGWPCRSPRPWKSRWWTSSPSKNVSTSLR